MGTVNVYNDHTKITENNKTFSKHGGADLLSLVPFM